ncbi:MAG: bifunctional UDP-3-O-[3-hydroxymyristoyl] N-acetylglucosamine deacetylase/3-hydroxyacyl-ACP dehydratase [Bacteroidota bacterium]
MIEKQNTIQAPVTVSGVGLHTGQTVTLTFKPAPEDTGIRFLRTDLDQEVYIEADADYVIDTSRGTTIEKEGVKLLTVEHVVAAITGMDIDNIIVEVDCSETPILDGSSRAYVEALQKAGIQKQEAARKYFEITETIRFYDEEKDCEFIAIPAENYRISCMIDYNSKVLGSQFATLDRLSDFKTEIAPCRTFVFLHELEFLLSQNLIKGGDLSNAFVFVDRPIQQEELDRLAKLFNKPSVEVRSEGILNNLEPYFANEPARHKLLDIVGDLSLAGRRIKGHIVASKPGHASNVKFAQHLKKLIKKKIAEEHIPVYNPDEKPVYDMNDIKRMLPHRYPFLLVDKIIEISDSHVIGIKNVTMNESFFSGHFPNEPVMPGVLQIEAMAQTGGILILSTVDDPENYSTYFLKIDNVKFKQKVIPGDTLILSCNLISPVRRGICHMRCVGYVGSKVVLEAELMAQIVKKSNT